MPERATRDALLEEGALLLAAHGVTGVTAKELHAAAGARNASALHYHFGDQQGLVDAIIEGHLRAVEQRRAVLVGRIEAEGRTGDLRALVHALTAPLAEDLATPLGRAHLRLVAQVSRPAAVYEPAFRSDDAPAGRQVSRWLRAALPDLPEELRRERLVALRAQLIGMFALRAVLLDTGTDAAVVGTAAAFLENLVDMLVAGLRAPASPAALAAAAAEAAGAATGAEDGAGAARR